MQPIIPQPQPLRGPATVSRGRARIIVIALIAAMLSSAATFAAYAYWANEHLYTQDEALELVQGVSRAVGERAFRLGQQQKCDRNI